MARDRVRPLWLPNVEAYPKSLLDLLAHLIDVRSGVIVLPAADGSEIRRAFQDYGETDAMSLVDEEHFAERSDSDRYGGIAVVPTWYNSLPYANRVDRNDDAGSQYLRVGHIPSRWDDLSPDHTARRFRWWARLALGTLNDTGRACLVNNDGLGPPNLESLAPELVGSGRLEAVVAVETVKDDQSDDYHGHTILLLSHPPSTRDRVLFIDARGLYQSDGPNKQEFAAAEVEFIANIARLHRGEPTENRYGSASMTADAFPGDTYQDVPGLCAARTVDEVLSQHPVSLHPAYFVVPFADSFTSLDNLGEIDPKGSRIGDLVQLGTTEWLRSKDWPGGEPLLRLRFRNRRLSSAVFEWLNSQFAPTPLGRTPTVPQWSPTIVRDAGFQDAVSELGELRDSWPRPVPNLFDALGSGLGGWADTRPDLQGQIEEARAVTLRAGGIDPGSRRGSYRDYSEDPSQ